MSSLGDFKRQIIRSSAQWDSGLSFGLKRDSGLSTFPSLNLNGSVCVIDDNAMACSIVADECEQLYWVNADAPALYITDIKDCLSEKLIDLIECDESGTMKHQEGRLILTKELLWWHDKSQQRIVAFARDNYQLIHSIENIPDLLDFTFDGKERLYLLSSQAIYPYQLQSFRLGSPINIEEKLFSPVAIVMQAELNRLIVLGVQIEHPVHKKTPAILRIEINNSQQQHVYTLRYQATAHEFEFLAKYIQALPDGSLLIAQENIPLIFQFDVSGGLLDWISLSPNTLETFCIDSREPSAKCIVFNGPEYEPDRELKTLCFFDDEPSICSMTVNQQGDVFVGTNMGLYSISSSADAGHASGKWYSGSLDNGAIVNERWHRLDMFAEIPPGTAIDVFYACAEDTPEGRLKADTVNRLLKDEGFSDVEKINRIEAQLSHHWIGPERFAGKLPRVISSDDVELADESMLFREDCGRYLWLKIELHSFAGNQGPSINELNIIYPRKSYLRYLPAFYQEDPASAALLERILSPFETVFEALELKLNQLYEFFDPKSTPTDFVPWLSRWLNIALDEDWPQSVQRKLLLEAVSLYRFRGTPRGLADFIEIVFAQRPLILESSQYSPPFILHSSKQNSNQLNQAIMLGIDSVVAAAPVRGSVIGWSAKIGYSALRSELQNRADVWRARAFRFSVLMPMSDSQFTHSSLQLKRFIRQQCPAHTIFNLRQLPLNGLGCGGFLGINTQLENPQAIRLGVEAVVGKQVVGDSTVRAQLGKRSCLGFSMNLT